MAESCAFMAGANVMCTGTINLLSANSELLKAL
jgi:hypothetical protein